MSDPKTVIIATRKSMLALAQSRAWGESLKRARPELALGELQITTTGDRILDRALSEIGGKGLFVKEIEEAILRGEAQVAVHSMKDMPAELAPGLLIGCVPPREDARDVMISRSGAPLAELPRGAKIGTSSLRRQVQLRELRPDLQLVPLRGNVDTRMKKCEAGEVDAIILARAGLARLGLTERVTEVFEPELMLPAVGQGALAIEVAAADSSTLELLRSLTHRETELAVAAERGVMRAVDGNCQVPIAAFAVRKNDGIFLRGLLANADGSQVARAELEDTWPVTVEEATQLGLQLGARLLK